ncbi:MAG: diheme cytochrome c [Arcobacteraceae bacterium]
MKKLITILATTTILFAQSGVKPVDNKLYIKECGSCHFTFQAGLLPQRSWTKMMNNLENHFNTDASLEKEDYDAILNYLSKNSSENAMEYKRSRKITNSISSYDTPLKITDVPYFIQKHRELPQRVITQKDVKTLSNCMACHTTANKGIYSERAIKIPNYGRWDD